MDIVLDANIVIELPESLQCTDVQKMKLPKTSIDVAFGDNPTRTLQHEGCGKKGYKIIISKNILNSSISDSAGKKSLDKNAQKLVEKKS